MDSPPYPRKSLSSSGAIMTNVFASFIDGSKKADDGKTWFIGHRMIKPSLAKQVGIWLKDRPSQDRFQSDKARLLLVRNPFFPRIEDIDYWSEFQLPEECKLSLTD